MRVVAIGRTRALLESIRSIHDAGFEIPLVVTGLEAPEYDVVHQDFENLAMQIGAEFLFTEDINSVESVAVLRRSEADVAVSVNWAYVIREGACSAFPHGILNAHAGDLPRYRGNAPAQWAILQGEEHVGVTIHEMEPGVLDSGPVYAKEFFSIEDSTRIEQVFDFLNSRVPQMFVDVLKGLSSSLLIPIPQTSNTSSVLRCYPRRPEDGRINWTWPANQIDRLIRVSSEPYAGAFTFFRGERMIAWRACLERWDVPSLAVPGQVIRRETDSGHVLVATGDDLIRLKEVEVRDGRTVRPADVIKSLRDRLGS